MRKKVKIAVGRSFRLRNGATVKIINQRQVTLKSGDEPYRFWVGLIADTRQKITFEIGGNYSPVSIGPLDIVGRARA